MTFLGTATFYNNPLLCTIRYGVTFLQPLKRPKFLDFKPPLPNNFLGNIDSNVLRGNHNFIFEILLQWNV